VCQGSNDDNTGTYPIQSERYFAALKGNGAVTRLVMLPFESHAYRARESILHTLAEQAAWLHTYVTADEETARKAKANAVVANAVAARM
jgi:dipeptidyl aminopeptidase/acylaminoacyl peptidase